MSCTNEDKIDLIREHEDDKHLQVVMEGCYNCKYFRKLYKHPLNTIEELKGSISTEAPIFACTVFYEVEGDDGLIILTDKYDQCEMFEEVGKSKETGLSEQQVRSTIKKLISTNEITSNATNEQQTNNKQSTTTKER